MAGPIPGYTILDTKGDEIEFKVEGDSLPFIGKKCTIRTIIHKDLTYTGELPDTIILKLSYNDSSSNAVVLSPEYNLHNAASSPVDYIPPVPSGSHLTLELHSISNTSPFLPVRISKITVNPHSSTHNVHDGAYSIQIMENTELEIFIEENPDVPKNLELIVIPEDAYISDSKPDTKDVTSGKFSKGEIRELSSLKNKLSVIQGRYNQHNLLVGSVALVSDEHAVDVHFKLTVNNIYKGSHYVYDVRNIVLFYSDNGKWKNSKDILPSGLSAPIIPSAVASSSPTDVTVRLRALFSSLNTDKLMVHFKVILRHGTEPNDSPIVAQTSAAFIISRAIDSAHDATVRIQVQHFIPELKRYGINPRYNLFGLNITQNVTVPGTGFLGFKKQQQTNDIYSQNTLMTDDSGILCAYESGVLRPIRIPAKKIRDGPIRIDLKSLADNTRQGRENIKLPLSEMSFDPKDGVLQQQKDNTYNMTITLNHTTESRVRSVFVEMYEMQYSNPEGKNYTFDQAVELAKKNAVPAQGVPLNFQVFEGNYALHNHTNKAIEVDGVTNSQGIFVRQFVGNDNLDEQLSVLAGSIRLKTDDYFLYENSSKESILLDPKKGEWPHIKVYLIKKQDCVLKLQLNLVAPLTELPRDISLLMTADLLTLPLAAKSLSEGSPKMYTIDNVSPINGPVVISKDTLYPDKNHIVLIELYKGSSVAGSFISKNVSYTFAISSDTIIYPFESSRVITLNATKNEISEVRKDEHIVLDQKSREKLIFLRDFIKRDIAKVSPLADRYERKMHDYHIKIKNDSISMNSLYEYIKLRFFVQDNKGRFAFAAAFYETSPKIFDEFERLTKSIRKNTEPLTKEIVDLQKVLFYDPSYAILDEENSKRQKNAEYFNELAEVLSSIQILHLPHDEQQALVAVSELCHKNSNGRGFSNHKNSINNYLYSNMHDVISNFHGYLGTLTQIEKNHNELYLLVKKYHKDKKSLNIDQEKRVMKELTDLISVNNKNISLNASIPFLVDSVERNSKSVTDCLHLFVQRAQSVVNLFDRLLTMSAPSKK